MSSSIHPKASAATTAPKSSYEPAPHPNGVRLLSLDGGGVRGVASLLVLDRIMQEIQKRTGSEEPCRPVDYFELAGGTSTGGIIAIMLFRLNMTAAQALEEYFIIAQRIFSPKLFGHDISWAGSWAASMISNLKLLFQASRFDDKDLKKAIDDVVEKYGLDPDDKEKKGKALLARPEALLKRSEARAGRMFCCTTAKNKEETVLFRSYKVDDHIKYHSSYVNDALREGQDQITIGLAASSTSAAPSYFPEVNWLVNKRKLVFWDGGLLNNNPIDQLWYSRYDLAHPPDDGPDVSCVLSLGTGYVKPDSSKGFQLKLLGIANSVVNFATNSNAKGKDFSRHMSNLEPRQKWKNTKYFRFNPPLRMVEIGLSDYTKMRTLKKITEDYLAKDQEAIEKAVDAIMPPPEVEDCKK